MKSKGFKIKFKRKGCRGATMVEFALAFPLIMSFIFLILAYGYLVNVQGTFKMAVANGMRLALTRGDANLDIIQDLENWNSWGAMPPKIAKLLAHRNGTGKMTDLSVIKNYYNINTAGKIPPLYTGSNDFLSLPRTYQYALAYIHLTMLDGVGPNTLSFPCDPEENTADSFGCLSCEFHNPDAMISFSWPEDPDPLFNDHLDQRRISISCTYKPDAFLLKPFFALLSIMGINTANNILLLKEKKTI